jgi:hypothetical protein
MPGLATAATATWPPAAAAGQAGDILTEPRTAAIDVYLDTSVALAQLLAEDCTPPATLWEAEFRLPIESGHLHARGLSLAAGLPVSSSAALRGLELAPPVLTVLSNLSTPIRTWTHCIRISISAPTGPGGSAASYGDRMLKAAASIEVYPV